eukprot:10981173-Alexandrium_andersonii.AAC.1
MYAGLTADDHQSALPVANLSVYDTSTLAMFSTPKRFTVDPRLDIDSLCDSVRAGERPWRPGGPMAMNRM